MAVAAAAKRQKFMIIVMSVFAAELNTRERNAHRRHMHDENKEKENGGKKNAIIFRIESSRGFSPQIPRERRIYNIYLL